MSEAKTALTSALVGSLVAFGLFVASLWFAWHDHEYAKAAFYMAFSHVNGYNADRNLDKGRRLAATP